MHCQLAHGSVVSPQWNYFTLNWNSRDVFSNLSWSSVSGMSGARYQQHNIVLEHVTNNNGMLIVSKPLGSGNSAIYHTHSSVKVWLCMHQCSVYQARFRSISKTLPQRERCMHGLNTVQVNYLNDSYCHSLQSNAIHMTIPVLVALIFLLL